MSGPLPTDGARRRNLPPSKDILEPRTGRAPKIPRRYQLGDAGLDYWKRAWKWPQATKWDTPSMVDAVARRAQLEDYAAAIELVDHVDLEELLTAGDDEARREALRNLDWALNKLRSLATGVVGLMKQMDQLDDRLGTTPKAMAQLRWSIAEKPAKTSAQAAAAAEVAQMADYRDRLGA